MSHEDVVAALTEAAAADSAPEAPAEQAVETPSTASAPAPVEGAPEESATPEVQAPKAPEHTPEPEAAFNPDELPPELLPAWKQMQAAFTPRLQEAAAIKKQFEELGGIESAQQAVDLYQRVSDPQNWPQLYEELYQAMERAGFEFEDPNAAQSPVVSSPFGQLAEEDPDLAPLVTALQNLEGRTNDQQQLIESFLYEQEAQRQVAEEELRQAQYLASLQQQVTAVRQANPQYTDADVRAIIELGSFYGDDIALAQQRYEQIVSDRLTRYFESKKVAGAATSTQPVAGAGVLSEQEKEHADIRDVEDEVVELMRRLQAEGEIDF